MLARLLNHIQQYCLTTWPGYLYAGLSMFYLFVYSMGLAIPFLITAWMLTAATSRLKMLNRYMWLIERVSGAFILIVGILLVTGTMTILNSYANQIVPAWLIENL